MEYRGCNHMQPVGMVYAVWQRWDTCYEPCKALSRGTLFPVLDKPFYGMGGGCRK